MEFFNKAKSVRLLSHLGKYLLAEEDEESVHQSRDGSSRRAHWTVELVEGHNHLIRLKSCFNKYLTATDEPSLMGMNGKKVMQTIPCTKKDSSVEWEPITEGFQVKLRARHGGKFLRANGGTPPWRNTVTHDIPHRTATQIWVLWIVEVMDILEFSCDERRLSTSFSSASDDSVGVNRELKLVESRRDWCTYQREVL